jgi:hypothetical protein
VVEVCVDTTYDHQVIEYLWFGKKVNILTIAKIEIDASFEVLGQILSTLI